jgi:hypothetical protein
MPGSGSTHALLFATLLVVSIGAVAPPQKAPQPPGRYTISGRVLDPHKLEPEAATLMLGQPDGESSFGSTPVKVAADGRFVTRLLTPGTYVLEVIRTPHSPVKPATPVAFTSVRVANADVKDVTVTIQRDTALTGRFKMESGTPAAAWPTHIHVLAQVALEEAGFLGSKGADGAPGGTFVLRNAFGPRVLRCGYSLAPGSHWWPSRVLLNGRDITNVPTDFSAHENGQLEVVFTQHPAGLTGTVRNPQGEIASAPWIVVTSADRSLWQWWATTTTVAQGNTKGAFSMALLPGEYLIRAVPQPTFASWEEARRQAQRYASEGVPVTVNAWGKSKVALTLQP